MPSVHQKPCFWALARIKLALFASIAAASGIAYFLVAAVRHYGIHR